MSMENSYSRSHTEIRAEDFWVDYFLGKVADLPEEEGRNVGMEGSLGLLFNGR